MRIDHNSFRYCVTSLDEPLPAFSQEAVDTWAWATDTMRIGLSADAIAGDGPKTAVRVPKLRKILNATETLTVQRREGLMGSYTITVPSFTVVGEARFYPLTPLSPPDTAWQSPGASVDSSRSEDAPDDAADSNSADIGFGEAPEPTASDLRQAATQNQPRELSTNENTNTPMTAVYEIRHAYPHYDVEKGFFEDPLR